MGLSMVPAYKRPLGMNQEEYRSFPSGFFSGLGQLIKCRDIGPQNIKQSIHAALYMMPDHFIAMVRYKS